MLVAAALRVSQRQATELGRPELGLQNCVRPQPTHSHIHDVKQRSLLRSRARVAARRFFRFDPPERAGVHQDARS
jgi:hypothetical protein